MLNNIAKEKNCFAQKREIKVIQNTKFSQNREIKVSRNMRTSTSRNKSVAKISCNKVFINLEGKTERIIFRDVCETAWVVL